MTPAQSGWLEQYAPRWVIGADADLGSAFGRTGRLVVEIGTGHGETIAAAAAAMPETDFVGFEVFEPSVAATLGKLAAGELANVRLVMADAVTALPGLVPDSGVSEFWVFFPDPWPKRRHHKRRLVSPGFAALLARKLVVGGVVRLATDQASYADTIRTVFGADPRFLLDSTERFTLRPLTRFESRGIAAGRAIQDFAYRLVTGDSGDVAQ